MSIARSFRNHGESELGEAWHEEEYQGQPRFQAGFSSIPDLERKHFVQQDWCTLAARETAGLLMLALLSVVRFAVVLASLRDHIGATCQTIPPRQSKSGSILFPQFYG